MKEKKKFKIRKIFKSRVLFFIFGALIFGTIGVGASTLLSSSDVAYDNSSSGLSAINLQDALDELNEKASGGTKVICDDDNNCTVTCKNGKPTITDSGYMCPTTVTCPSGTKYVATSTGYKCAKPAGEQLKENVVTSGSGLYVDSYENGSYIYKGASPNNYITFSGSTWRILAVEADGTLKIMKANSIGNMKYDSYASGAWSSATLNTYLNGTYYNTLDSTYIQKHSFNVGNVSSSSSLTTTINEEKTATWTGNIALANVSDYIKSNTNTSNCGSISSIQSNYSTCKTSSFIGTTLAISNYSWLLSLNSVDTNFAWYVLNNGSFDADYVTNIYSLDIGVMPVIYLSSSITLSGSGTQSDPYTIN